MRQKAEQIIYYQYNSSSYYHLATNSIHTYIFSRVTTIDQNIETSQSINTIVLINTIFLPGPQPTRYTQRLRFQCTAYQDQ